MERQVEFVTAQSCRGCTSCGRGRSFITVVKLKTTSLPKFSGSMTDIHRWGKDWESQQKEGELSGSAKVKKIQLLDSIDGHPQCGLCGTEATRV